MGTSAQVIFNLDIIIFVVIITPQQYLFFGSTLYYKIFCDLQFTVHTSLSISCDIFKKNAISIFIRYFENDPIIA